jgi:hypothetical protein
MLGPDGVSLDTSVAIVDAHDAFEHELTAFPSVQ